MGTITKALAITNPLLYIIGTPIIVGMSLAVMLNGYVKGMKKVLKNIDF